MATAKHSSGAIVEFGNRLGVTAPRNIWRVNGPLAIQNLRELISSMGEESTDLMGKFFRK